MKYRTRIYYTERLKASGKAPVSIREVPENLEDDDLLEITNVGLIKIRLRRGILEAGLQGPYRA